MEREGVKDSTRRKKRWSKYNKKKHLHTNAKMKSSFHAIHLESGIILTDLEVCKCVLLCVFSYKLMLKVCTESESQYFWLQHFIFAMWGVCIHGHCRCGVCNLEAKIDCCCKSFCVNKKKRGRRRRKMKRKPITNNNNNTAAAAVTKTRTRATTSKNSNRRRKR